MKFLLICTKQFINKEFTRRKEQLEKLATLMNIDGKVLRSVSSDEIREEFLRNSKELGILLACLHT